MTRRIRPILLASAVLAGGASLFAEPVFLRDLSTGDGPLRMSVGAVRGPLWSAAFAQGAGDYTLENVTISLESSTFTFKSMRVTGATSPRAEMDAIFAKGSTEPLSDRIAKFAAKEIAISEIAGEVTGAASQRISYRDVVLGEVAGGMIKTLTVGSTTIDSTVGSDVTKAFYGRMTCEDTNLAALLRFYIEGGNPSASFTTAQRTFSGENIVVTDPNGLTMKIARVDGRDFQVRPLAEPAWSIMTRAATMSEKDKPSNEEAFEFFKSAIGLYDSIQIGSAEVRGVEFSGPSDKGPVTARVARIAYTAGTADKPADARAEGLNVSAAEGTAKIDLIAFTGFSFENTFATLRSLKDPTPLADLDPATLRALIPTLGTIRYSGVAFDAPNTEAKTPERVRFGLKDMELTADKPINGIPTNVRLAVQNFAMPLSSFSSEDGIKEIVALGYDNVDMSWGLAANWNEAAKEIALSEVSFNGVGMGRVSLKGVIAGVSRDAFDPDTTAATIALLGATARSVDLTIENTGLFERFLAADAKKQKKSADALRREYGAAAAVAIPMLLGNTDQAKTLGQAVARFVAKPVRLRITAKAKDPAGLGVADVLSAPDPSGVLRKLDITAVAEDKI